MMLKLTSMALVATTLSLGGCMTAAPTETAALSCVGGAAMYPTKTIVENAIKSPDHSRRNSQAKSKARLNSLELGNLPMIDEIES